jgi:hypothetical protein
MKKLILIIVCINSLYAANLPTEEFNSLIKSCKEKNS